MSKRGFRDDGGHQSREKVKKRRSRWEAEELKTIIPGMPTQLPPTLTADQQENYLLQFQIEEISRKLRSGDLGIPPNPEDRSPSPEPVYNSEGKRMNTRDYRTRKKLEEERHKFVQKLLQVNPEYKPPSDYKPPQIRITDKVFIPQENFPEINFVGLLIGPRGNTLKALEKETGAKVIIRGKGSVKEGKVGRKDGLPMPGEDEPLHAYVTASTSECVVKAVNRINEIIQQGIEVPEGENDLRKQQLRELALLNGTLRENDGLIKLRQLAEAQTIVTNTILCNVCGGMGHVAADCKSRRPGETLQGLDGAPPEEFRSPAERAKMDSEYTALMAELGVGGVGPPGGMGGGFAPRAPGSNDTSARGPRPWQAPRSGSNSQSRPGGPQNFSGGPPRPGNSYRPSYPGPPGMPPPPGGVAPPNFPPPPGMPPPPGTSNYNQSGPPGTSNFNQSGPPGTSNYNQSGPPGSMNYNQSGPPGSSNYSQSGPPNSNYNQSGPPGSSNYNQSGPPGSSNYNQSGPPGSSNYNQSGPPGVRPSPPRPPGTSGPPPGMSGGNSWQGPPHSGPPGNNWQPPPPGMPPMPPPPPPGASSGPGDRGPPSGWQQQGQWNQPPNSGGSRGSGDWPARPGMGPPPPPPGTESGGWGNSRGGNWNSWPGGPPPPPMPPGPPPSMPPPPGH